MHSEDRPLVVGVGGSSRDESITDRVLTGALAEAAARGARTVLFDGAFLGRLPMYPTHGEVVAEAVEYLETVRRADGVIVASPGYHGGISGLVKNGLDYLELLRNDVRPYLDGRPVGTIVTAAGAQAAGTTLLSLRSIVHALRGWPTPYGAAINTAAGVIDDEGMTSREVSVALRLVADQVMDFVSWRWSAR